MNIKTLYLNKINKLRKQILINLDDNFDYIDYNLGLVQDKELQILQVKINNLTVKKDVKSDILLNFYA